MFVDRREREHRREHTRELSFRWRIRCLTVSWMSWRFKSAPIPSRAPIDTYIFSFSPLSKLIYMHINLLSLTSVKRPAYNSCAPKLALCTRFFIFFDYVFMFSAAPILINKARNSHSCMRSPACLPALSSPYTFSCASAWNCECERKLGETVINGFVRIRTRQTHSRYGYLVYVARMKKKARKKRTRSTHTHMHTYNRNQQPGHRQQQQLPYMSCECRAAIHNIRDTQFE